MRLPGRRAVWLGVAAAAVALVVAAALLHRPSERDHGRVPKPSFLTRNAVLPSAARRTAIDFIHAVAARDPAGWKLLDRTFPCPGQSRKRAWRRLIPVPRYRRVRFMDPYTSPRGLSIGVIFDQRFPFDMVLKRGGAGRWRVSYWDGHFPAEIMPCANVRRSARDRRGPARGRRRALAPSGGG
jgi:hypothetical protein